MLPLLPALIVTLMSFLGFDTNTVVAWSIFALLMTLTLASLFYTNRRSLTALLIPVGLFASIVTAHWPLRLTFAASKHALDRVADRLEAGEEITSPEWAGVFYIRKAEINYKGMPCLWIWLGSDGKTGFARPADGVAIGKFNDWSDCALSAMWHLISED
ncbi:MAG: hypothetical protein ACR2HJ_01150 [Fimbriimonadales bacterium]